MSRIDRIGIILKGRYCMIEQIGQGGEGNLYLARDMELGTLWAVKELPLERKKEAKLMRLLEHPALPKMMDYTERGEFCYLVMEYIRGKSIREWMEEGRSFSLEEILHIGQEVTEVMEYFHKQKPAVYYGDLKPDNLMLTEKGRLYLVDLGSAVFGYRESQKICIGTPGFAAPEQHEGRMTAASDIYAFGKTLSALCGRNRKRYIFQHPRLGFLLWKCCRKEEKLRYPDMVTVRKEIRTISENNIPAKIRNLWMLLFMMLCIILSVLVWLRNWSERPVLEERLTEVTQNYYSDAFLHNSLSDRKKICAETEKELQLLLKEYPEKEFQRKLLLMLALNSELQGEEEHAAIYYEQLLLYDENYGEAYGQYGLFLCRIGLREESIRLWEKYHMMEKKTMESMEPGTFRQWRERLYENMDGDGNEITSNEEYTEKQ